MIGFRRFWDLLFGCWHNHLSFPHSNKRTWPGGRANSDVYVVCLECGKRFAYDWEEMRVLRDGEQPARQPAWELQERNAR